MSEILWKPNKKAIPSKKQRILVTDFDKQRFQGFIREIQKQNQQADVIKLSTVNNFGIYLPPSPNDSKLGNDGWFENISENDEFPSPDKLTPAMNGNHRSFYTPSSMTI